MHAADSGHIRGVLTQRDGTSLPEVLDGLLRRGALTRFEVAELDRDATAEVASHFAGRPLADLRDGLRCGRPIGTCKSCIHRRDAFYRPLSRQARRRPRPDGLQSVER